MAIATVIVSVVIAADTTSVHAAKPWEIATVNAKTMTKSTTDVKYLYSSTQNIVYLSHQHKNL